MTMDASRVQWVHKRTAEATTEGTAAVLQIRIALCQAALKEKENDAESCQVCRHCDES